MLLPLNRIDSVSCPSQASQRPPAVLKEKRLAVKPRMRASVVSA